MQLWQLHELKSYRHDGVDGRFSMIWWSRVYRLRTKGLKRCCISLVINPSGTAIWSIVCYQTYMNTEKQVKKYKLIIWQINNFLCLAYWKLFFSIVRNEKQIACVQHGVVFYGVSTL